MIKFGFESYQTEFPNWSRHHKTVGTHVKRVYEDGEIILPNDENLKEIIIKHENLLKPKEVQLRRKGNFELRSATDYYLPLENLEYETPTLDYYSVGASNTKQTTHVRATFFIEDNKFILNYQYKSSGSFASSFYDMLDMGGIENMIEEVVEQENPLEEVGITKGKEEDYNIVVVTSDGEITDFEVEKRELLKSLVGIEIYRFEDEIVD